MPCRLLWGSHLLTTPLSLQVVIPLQNAEIDQSGPLVAMLKEEGSPVELEQLLAADPQLRDIRVALPQPGVPMPVAL